MLAVTESSLRNTCESTVASRHQNYDNRPKHDQRTGFNVIVSQINNGNIDGCIKLKNKTSSQIKN